MVAGPGWLGRRAWSRGAGGWGRFGWWSPWLRLGGAGPARGRALPARPLGGWLGGVRVVFGAWLVRAWLMGARLIEAAAVVGHTDPALGL